MLRRLPELAPLVERSRDGLEHAVAVAVEGELHDRRAGLVEALAHPARVQILAGELGPVVEEVVVDDGRVRAAGTAAPVRSPRLRVGAAAGEDHQAVRNLEDLLARKELRVAGGEQLGACVGRARDQVLLLAEEEELRRLAGRLREPLDGREQRVARRVRDRVEVRVDRGAGEVRLEVVQLELRRLADQRRGLGRIVDAGELDHDLVRLLLADLGLGHARAVQALLHDRDRGVEIGRRDRVRGRVLRLQHDLEPALQVEAQRRMLLDRRARHLEHHRPDQGRDDQREHRQMFAAFTH